MGNKGTAEVKAAGADGVPAGNDKKLSLINKIGYGLGESGSQCSWALISGYLSLYYTDVVGLMPVVVSAILLIARIWDAVNDPMFGALAERSRFKKLGRYRGWIMVGTPFLALFNCLTFLNLDISDPLKTIYCGVTYICCGMAYTVVNISTGALANNMTINPEERSSLYSWRGTCGNVVSFILNLVTMPLILFFGNGSTSDERGYFYTALIFSIVCIPLFLLCVTMTKEVVFAKQEHTERKKGKIGSGLKETWRSFKITFSNYNTAMLVLANIFSLVGALGRLGIISYYFVYILKSPLGMTASITSMTVGSTIAYVLAPAIMKKMNKKMVGLWSAILVSITYVGFFAIGEAGMSNMLIPLSFISGLVNATQPAMYSITGDIIDDCWIRTGKRTDGVTYSTISFATKFGMAIGSSVGVLLLSLSGFVANTEMSRETLTRMNAVTNLLPIVFVMLGGIFFALIRMTNKKALENEKLIKEMNLSEEVE